MQRSSTPSRFEAFIHSKLPSASPRVQQCIVSALVMADKIRSLVKALSSVLVRAAPFPVAVREASTTPVGGAAVGGNDDDEDEGGVHYYSTAMLSDTLIRNSDMTNIADSRLTVIDDAVGRCFRRKQLLCVFVHSELSFHSCELLRVLQEEDVTEAAVEQEFVVQYSLPNVVMMLRSQVVCYCVSMFSDEFSGIPAAAGCCAPAVLTFAPVGGSHGMAHVGTIEGPLAARDVFLFLRQSLDKWKRWQNNNKKKGVPPSR